MPLHRWPIRLVTAADALGVREELIGDVLEEIARGRSMAWAWQQVIGLYAFAVVAQLRHRARLNPPIVAAAIAILLLTATLSIGSVGNVLEAWLGVYYVSGILSLFAHMTSRAVVDRERE